MRSEPPYSRETGNRIDVLVRELASSALDQAVALLQPRRGLMDELVEMLIRDETIEGEAFRAVVTSHESVYPLPTGSAVTLQATGKADVETAQVGV